MDTTLTHEPIATAVAPTTGAHDACLDFFTFGPEAMQAMSARDQRVARSDLERSLVELVRIRVSQINGCAFCLDRHVAEARKYGEKDRRLAILQAWRDVPFFSERERAALEWGGKR